MRSQTSQVRIIHSALSWLSPALKGWTEANERYAQAFRGDDALYWWDERPNIGALAAGAWLGGLVAIEEYKAFKGEAKLTDKPNGRTDLFISQRNGLNAAVIEAKMHWWGKGESGRLATKMLKACADACRNNEIDTRIGCSFVIPRWEKKRASQHDIDDFVTEAQGSAGKLDALAWSFPISARELHPPNKNSKFVYPGILIAMRLARTK